MSAAVASSDPTARRRGRSHVAVRRAAAADVGRILALAEQMHGDSGYAFLPFDPAKVRALIVACTIQKDHFAAVALRDGEVIGFLGGKLGAYPFCDEQQAYDLGVYVDPRHRRSTAAVRLLRAFVAWGTEQGAREIVLNVSLGGDADRVRVLYGRMGFARAGGNYRARVGGVPR